jgi:hypothetical protein
MPIASRIVNANFVAPVHHGNPVHLLKPNCNRGEYVAFLGRISPEKRPGRGHSNHPTLADEDLRAAELSPPERPPPSFRKCVQVVREPAEWPTKLIQIKQRTLVPSRLTGRL